jgi:5,10-methylene-tetrahydrofolate dehydrogenase/methenyl tetrahydrofolate cyclohydrolase
MRLTKTKLKQLIKEEIEAITEEDPANAERAIWAGYGRDPEQATYAALVQYAAEKMRHGLEVMNHDAATAEEEARNHLLNLVNDALEEAADIEL